MSAHTPLSRRALCALLLLSSTLGIAAHEHHEVDTGPYVNPFVNEEEMDSMIKWHIGIQILCWGILFPAGMILGITRSRFHVPWQGLTVVLSLCGNFLGHHHSGRAFHMTAHAHFASFLWWYMMLQTAFGIFLKLHVMEGTLVRRSVVMAHGIIGKLFPLFGWSQMVLGGIAATGFCFGEHLGQCLAHEIMGSGFIAYGIILLIMLRVGANWLARREVSQEYLDSWVIMVWGIINTFTEHNFLKPGQSRWNHKDLQHTSLGVLWWAGGALGIWLARKGKRNVLPALIIGLTGYAMANHGQALEFSAVVHKLFGWALMAAGAARVVEVCFVLRDAPTPPSSASDPSSPGPQAFQHLTPFLLVLSGLTFMAATEEQMAWLASSIMDSTTYSILLFSLAFVVYLVPVALVDLYEAQLRSKSTAAAVGVEQVEDLEGGVGGVRARSPAPSRNVFAAVLGFVEGLAGGAGRAGATASNGRGRERGHLRSSTADYESMPLTASRESADVRGGSVELDRVRGGGGEGSPRERDETDSTGRRTIGSDETVFELGEYEDDGGDNYWEEKDVAGGRQRRT
ncbi:hypothetical protein JCM10207_009152 [Rhodosporidiobolus poonsookiae]